MSTPVTFRTKKYEDLKKLADKKDMSVSSLSGQIIEEYLVKHYAENYEMFYDGKNFLASAFEHLPPSSFPEVVKVGSRDCLIGAKMLMYEITLENLLSYIKGWIETNHLKLSEFIEKDYIVWRCETKMGKNYNEIASACFKKVGRNLGFSVDVIATDKDMFEIKFKK